MAKEGLKTLSYGYKKMPKDDLVRYQNEFNVETDDFREKLIEDMIYIGTFGLEDPLREGIEDTIRLMKYGSSNPDKIDS